MRNARDFEIGVPIVREHARQIARALAKEKSDQAVTADAIMKVLKQAAPKGYGPTKEDPYLVASFALYVGYILEYKFPSLSWQNIRFKKWKVFVQTSTKSKKSRNYRFRIGLQFLAQEPEFAAFTKLKIGDEGDLADVDKNSTELYEAMKRVCADEL